MPDAAVIERPEAGYEPRRRRDATRSRRRGVVALTAAGMIAVSGGAAYAYWTATGSGSATATAGTTVGVTITGTVAGTIYPGGTFTVVLKGDNTNTTPIKIGTVSATAFTTDIPACNTLIADGTNVDFSMADVVENQTLAASTNNISLTNNGSLVFNNAATENQDACKGAVVTVTLTATAGS